MPPAQPATCGIAGAVWTDGGLPLTDATLQGMLAGPAPRGGDGRRFFRREPTRGAAHMPVPGVTLGETCSVTNSDAATGQRSPAASEDQAVLAVLDGHFLNHATLRHRLEGAGHRMTTGDHAELLAHLYEDEGPDCFAHLEGAFVAAVWDAKRRQLVAACDRMAQRPLYHRVEPGRWLLANGLSAVLAADGRPREINPTALDEYLTYGYVPHPHCLWRGLQKLPPGYCAVYRDGQLHYRRYWQLDLEREDDRPVSELRRDLRARLEAAVAAGVAGLDRVGVLLSGGVDSAIVAALARRASDRPLETFYLKPPRAEGDTSVAAEALAEAIARQLGASHHAIDWKLPREEEIASLAARMDEPLGDPIILAQRQLAAAASQHVPCVLTGLGADELLAGRARYGAVLTWQERLPRWLRAILSPQWRSTDAGGQRRPALDEARGRGYLDEIALFDETARSDLYSEDFLARLPSADPYDLLRAALAGARGRDPISAVSLAELQTSLPGLRLASMEAAAATHGLECRHPFLATDVMELAASIPGRWKWRNGLGKRILREAFADLLPHDVLRQAQRTWPREDRAEIIAGLPSPVTARESPLTECFQAQALETLVCQSQQEEDRAQSRLWALAILDRVSRRSMLDVGR